MVVRSLAVDQTVRAVLLTEHDPTVWGRAYAAGDRPARLPYGIDSLFDRGYRFFVPSVSQRWMARRLRNAVEHRLGFPVAKTVRSLGAVAKSDVVIALLEQQGRAVSQAKARRLPPFSATPLVIRSCWLPDELSHLPREERTLRARSFLHADLVAHLSELEKDVLVSAGFREEQLLAIPYAIESNHYVPADVYRDLDIVAIGQDRGRDYATLLDAVRTTDLRLDIVCKAENLRGLDLPPNATFRGTVDHRAYRELLRRAKVIVVPTFEMLYATGSSVALEGASSGACVVVTGTPTMRDYFTDRENALLVPVRDADALRSTLLDAMADEGLRARLGIAGRELVSTRFDSAMMWSRIDDVMRNRGILPTR